MEKETQGTSPPRHAPGGRRKHRAWPYLRAGLLVLCVAVFLASGGVWAVSAWQARAQQQAFADLAARAEQARQTTAGQTAGQTASPYAEFAKENSDFAGWLAIEGTPVDYPVMYTPNEPEYYLRRAFDGSRSTAGTPFVGDGCTLQPPGDNLILYGHNMKDGSMFGTLPQYADKAFWQEHPLIRFDTLQGEGTYEVLAAFPITLSGLALDYYNYTQINSAKEYYEYLEWAKTQSLYDTGVTAEYGEKLLTLSTCAYHAEDGRFVIVAKKV